jgi:formylglycine-generating enzyme required for sulfatase activity
MQPNLVRSTLCVLNPGGKIVGTGFLVAADLAVTCAHVITLAEAVEGDPVQVRFTEQDGIFDAVVEPQSFRDPAHGDVAFLRLKSIPPDLQPFRLGLAKACAQGGGFSSFGYATAADVQGIYANGAFDGYLAEQDLLQLQSPQADHGLSGAPVFDDARGVVVGLIAKGHIKPGRNAETTFATPTELLFEICPAVRPSETCPYRGLQPFTAKTAQFFFGRQSLIDDQLLAALRREIHFLAVLGPSGSGKSSLVRAGLLPALAKDQISGSRDWPQFTIHPDQDPFAQLQAAGLDLSALPAGPARLILFIDQFEELFTLCPPKTAQQFVAALVAALADPRLRLVITLRDDFYSAFNAQAGPLAAFSPNAVINIPATLSDDELTAMIEAPAKALRLELEPGLTAAILADLTPTGAALSTALPLLEFTLSRLWDQRRDGYLLTHAAYRAMGGVTGSLARWADEAYGELAKDQTRRLLAESLFVSLVHLGEEFQEEPEAKPSAQPDTRRPRKLADYDPPVRELVTYFADKRLIATDGQMVALVHDALIHEWRQLQTWIENNRAALRLIQDAQNAAQQWAVDKKNRDLLLHRGARLQALAKLGADPRYLLAPRDRAYLAACKKAALHQKLLLWGGVALILAVTLLLAARVLGPYLTRTRAVAAHWATIPAGSFIMGMDQAEAEFTYAQCLAGSVEAAKAKCASPEEQLFWSGRRINAELPQFAILDNEVTNAQYQQCVNLGACQPPEGWLYEPAAVNRPAVNLNWYEAGAYCAWLGGRLPTAGEWQKAARGPAGSYFPWGNAWDLSLANLERAGVGALESVTRFAQTDLSDYGVMNLAGNVREWTASELPFDDVFNQPFTNTVLTLENESVDPWVVLHGGSWLNPRSDGIASNGGADPVLTRRPNVGFRCACPAGQACADPWNGWWQWFGKY